MKLTRTSTATRLLRSAQTADSQMMPNAQFSAWMGQKRAEVGVTVEPIPFSEMDKWGFDDHGNLRHESGRFFSIEGLDVRTDWHGGQYWQQPIINQPEIGFLGFIVQEHAGVLHFLCQAKVEPGNDPAVQLSPTLQATRSNYTQVHGGNAPLFLEYFTGEKPRTVLLDQLQSEQGARFLRKRNRNIIIEVIEKLTLPPQFCWLTLGQLKALGQKDNVLNMDSRTVISSIDFRHGVEAKTPTSGFGQLVLNSATDTQNAVHSFSELTHWVTQAKALHDLHQNPMPLRDVSGWCTTDTAIEHESGRYFRVKAFRAQITNREVMSWTQPLVESAQHGLIACICKPINGVLHFLIQRKMEGGNRDLIELTSTVHCLPDNYDSGTLPYLREVQQSAPEAAIIDTHQSEEGGRFYFEQNRNMIIMLPKDAQLSTHDDYKWLTLGQILAFAQHANYCTIQLRSLLSLLPYA